MASGVLGQAAPSATTNVIVYTVPTSATATFNINCLNRGSSAGTVRLALADTVNPSTSEWVEYDASVAAGGVLERTGMVAQAGKSVVVYASSADFTFSVYGYEV